VGCPQGDPVVILLALALLTAGPQDTLRLGPGEHAGPLVLTRPTVVLGTAGAILTNHGRGTVLVVQAKGSVVRGLTIEGSGSDPDHYDAGIRVVADSVTLEDLTIRNTLFGVYVQQARDVILRRLEITGAQTGRESDRGDGISFYASRAILAEQNHITWMRDGIYFSYSDSVVVRDNRVSHVRFGLHYMFSHANRFEGNVFTDNAAGAVIMNSRNVTVSGNVFAWNAGSRSYGLVLQTATDPVVRGNSFVGNGVGVFFDNVINGRFTDNLVASNWLGLELFANSEGTVVTGNALMGNTFDLSGGGAPDAYALCREGRGNYWSKAARDGYDLDGDGTLDAPHAASSPLAELALTHDNLRPLLDSPAARALEWAERTFPAFATAGAVDSCPLARPPRLAALGSLPPAPAARLGGTGPQAIAGAALFLGAGVVLAGFRGRRNPAREVLT
jgi:nitrous oxidase accessory protein